MAITNAQQARQMYKKGSMEPVEQAGVMNYMPSEMVTVPKIAKSSPDTPTAKLAYITPEEQDKLIDLDLYGSLDGKPNRGPGGIPSLEGDFGSSTGQASTGAGTGGAYSGGSGDEKVSKGRDTDYQMSGGKTGSTFETYRGGKNLGVDNKLASKFGNKEQRDRANKELAKGNLYSTGPNQGFFEKASTKNKNFQRNQMLNLAKKRSFQKYRDIEQYVNMMDDYGLSAEELAELVADDPSYGYDFSDLEKGKEFLGSNIGTSLEKYRKNLYDVNPSTTISPLQALLSATRPDTQVTAMNTLQKARDYTNLVNKADTMTNQELKDAMTELKNRGKTEDQINPPDRGGPEPLDPCLGPNPPAYCFIGQQAETPPEDPVFTPQFRFLNRGGMVEDAPMSGIMDLDTTRQMLFIGGIAKGISKGLKSVTRGLKKVAKSPLGKAALLGAVGFGIPGTQFGGLFGRAAFGKQATGFFGSKGIGPLISSKFSNMTLPKLITDNMGGLKVAALSGLGGALLASLEKKDDDDFDIEEYYKMAGLNMPENQYRFLAEGGSTEKEPVAKKTMPLLDMDGQEMDFRQDGGFVPIGRMEKADDVPARLSKNEFVFTAEAVRNAGGGDVDKGAEVMYNTMKNLEAGGEVSEETQGLEGARNMFQTSQRLGEVV